MTPDDCREAFEQFILQRNPLQPHMILREPGQPYWHHRTRDDWKLWQAAWSAKSHEKGDDDDGT